MKTIIAVDFDGTVVTHEFPNVGKDVGAVPVLKRLVAEGHSLILWTMRSGKTIEDAIDWFKTKEIPLYGIQYNPTQASWTYSNKCYAQLYIDDAALGAPIKRDAELSDRAFIDWEAVENILEMDGILPATNEFIQALREDMQSNDQKTPVEETNSKSE